MGQGSREVLLLILRTLLLTTVVYYEEEASRARPMSDVLRVFGKEIWVGEGPTVSYYGFDYPTRMVLIQLSEGRLVCCWHSLRAPSTRSFKKKPHGCLYVGARTIGSIPLWSRTVLNLAH
jgi:hypothetical protein